MPRKKEDVKNKLLFSEAHAKLSVNIKGYNAARLIEANLNYIIYKNVPSVIVYRSALKKFLLISSFRNMPAVQTGTFFTFPEWTRRKDYEEIIDYAGSRLTNKYIFRLSSLKLQPAFSLKNLFLAIKTTRGTSLNFRARFYITASLYNSLLLADDAEKHIKVKIKKYVSFSCVMGIENLMTQYFQKHGVPTYNLQHGITYLYEKNFSDEIEYHNLITDHHLAWGDYTHNELKRYGMSPGKIFTAGYPREVTLTDLRAPSGKNCMIFLSRVNFQPANIKLLGLLAEYNRNGNIRFTLKLHPSLNPGEVQHIIRTHYANAGFNVLTENGSLREVFNKQRIDFCIAVNSTAYYECYIHGVPSLRFQDDTFDMSHALTGDSFSTTEEFGALMISLYENFEEKFDFQKIRKELDYVLGLHKNEYARILS